MNKGISIIICTYNGAERLGQTIEHIARQTLSSIPWEVILADNASTDDSAAVGQSEWAKHHLPEIPFRVIYQPKPGKLYALRNAISEARYEYIITCDDDNWLAPDYAEKIYKRFESSASVAAIGGFGIPVTEGSALPSWFKDYEVMYAVGAQAKKTGLMTGRSVLWGAGLSTRRSLYLKMYKTYPSFLIQQERDIIFAEDSEYCLRLLLKGYKLFYDSSLIYHHFISDSKLDLNRRDSYIAQFRNADVVLRKYYAAIRAMLKTKGRPDIWLLLLITAPFEYYFSSSKIRKEKAYNTLFHMLPLGLKSDPVSTSIKAFVKK